MDADEEIRRGHMAEEVLRNPAFSEAFEMVRTAIFAQWGASPIRDVEGQHELRLMLKILNDFEGCLKATINSGKLAKFEIERSKEVKHGKQPKG